MLSQQKLEVSMKTQLRLRVLDLMELHSTGMTKCDLCGETVRRANAVESWRGNTLLFVACMNCLSAAPVEMVSYPDGLHIDHCTDQPTGLIRGASSLLPMKTKPMIGSL